MSNVVFELFAKLGLDSTEYSNGLKSAKGEATSFGGAIGNGLKSAAKIGVAALATVTTAATAFAASSVKAGADFDKSMSQVAATMGLSMSELQTQVGAVDTAWGTFDGNLREYAQFMGENTAFSAKQAADALNYMALAGYDVQESMTMLPNVLNLAAAGNMDLATASDMVTDAQTAFGIAMEDMPQLIDEMAKASSTGNTSVSQLGEAFLTVGGLAQELNGGFVTLADGTQAPVSGIEEMEIALTAMANAGVKGSEAGTHMRNMLLKLASPTSDGTKALEAMGVAVFDAEGNMRSLSDIFGDLNTELSAMTQEQKIQAISDLFNTRDLASAEALLNAVGQDWDEIGESILDSSGAAQKMADTQLDNLAGDVTLFQSALEGAKIAISDKLTPSLRKFTQFGTEGLSKVTSAFKEGGLTGAMTALSEVFSQGLTMVVEMLPEAINVGMQLLGAIGQGLLENLPVILDAGIQIVEMLADAMISGLPQALAGISEMIPVLMSKMTDLVLSLATKLSDPDSVQAMIQGGLSLIMALGQGLSENLPKIIEAAPKIITGLVQGIVQSLPMLIDGAIQILSGLTQFIIENLPLIIAAAYEIIFSLASGLIEAIPSLLMAGVQLVTSLVASLQAALPKFLANGMEITKAIVSGILSLLSSIAKAALDLVNKFIQTVIAQKEQLFDNGKKIIEMVKDGIKEKIDDAKQWGQDLIENFINGIKEKWEALKETVSGVAQSIWEFLHFSEPEKGPLSDFHTYAPDMMNLFMQGIEDNKARLLDTVADAFNFGDMIVSPNASVEAVGASGFNQTVNIYSPEELSPSEVARQTRNATRDMLLELRGL